MDTRAGLARIDELGRRDHYLAVAITQRRSGEPAASVVNAGVLAHPVSGEQVVAFVARGRTAKLAHLRRTPRATLVFRAEWEWIGVSGAVELAGPDDPMEGIDAERLRVLLRDIYHAAGGVHPDLDAYDREVVADRRTAVLITPERFTNNPTGADHQEDE